MLRTMNTKDGFAVVQAVKSGFLIGIITGGYSESVRKRFNDLGVTDVYIKSPNKYNDYLDFMASQALSPSGLVHVHGRRFARL